jgi:hypothetical protein
MVGETKVTAMQQMTIPSLRHSASLQQKMTLHDSRIHFYGPGKEYFFDAYISLRTQLTKELREGGSWRYMPSPSSTREEKAVH